MKKIFIQTALFLMLSILVQSAFSQTLEIKNSQVEYDDVKYPCIEVMLEPGTDEVKDAWKDFIKDKYDIKMKGYGFLTNKDVLRAEKTQFKAISEKQLDFYTRIVEKDGQTRVCAFASFGYDIHVNQEAYPQEYAAMKNVLQRFLKNYLPGYYDERISSAQDQLKNLRDERENMEKERKDNEKQIKELTKRNDELSKMLAENQEQIESVNKLLETKERTFKNVKDQLKTFETPESEK